MWVSLRDAGFPRYEVSDRGILRNKRTHYELKQWLNADGYMYIGLYPGLNDRKTKLCLVHRLVLLAHQPNENADKLTVDHVDRNRCHNHLSNLKWSDATNQARNRSASKNLCSARVIEVLKDGVLNRSFRTVTEAVKEFKILIFKDGMEVIKDAQVYILRYKRDIEIDGEIWRKVVVDGGEVCISNFGRRRHVNGRISIGSKANGYLKTTIYDSGTTTTKSYYMHRLVALAFVENKQKIENLVVNHIDSDRQNNRADNLEWVSMARNIADSALRGKLAKYKTRICTCDPAGLITCVYDSVTAAKIAMDLNYDSHIYRAIREEKLYKDLYWYKIKSDLEIVAGVIFTFDMKRQESLPKLKLVNRALSITSQ